MDNLNKSQIIKTIQTIQTIELNIVCISTTNETVNKRIKDIHEQLFKDQIKEVVVGFLFEFTQEEILNELPYLIQQMEYKKIFDLKRRQILVILHYKSGKTQNSNYDSEPVTLITKAINEYQNDVIDLNKARCYEVQTQMDFTKVIDIYKNQVQVDAAPFKINDKIDDEELNKLYYICLRECEFRELSCILLQANKVNERIFTNQKLANRIFQILKRWEDSEYDNKKKIDQDGKQSNK